MIWLSQIANLKENDALKLAEQFDFSGGQIENISRKCIVHSVLNGTSPDLAVLEGFCRDELIEKTSAKIGFTA